MLMLMNHELELNTITQDGTGVIRVELQLFFTLLLVIVVYNTTKRIMNLLLRM